MFRPAFVLLVCTVSALVACTEANPTAGIGLYPSARVRGASGTIAILAPLNGPNAERGRALVNAAKLALAPPGSPNLDVKDTGGTPEGAAVAASQAIAAGDSLIIGPLTTQETAAAAVPARRAGVALLAFTSDPAQAQPGVWILGLTPAQQIRRLVSAAMSLGKNHFAALLPNTAFGQAMSTALRDAATSAGATAPDVRTYSASTHAISAAVRDISGYATRRAPLDAKIKAARELHTAEGRAEAKELSQQSIGPPPFDALLLADSGTQLAEVTSFLGYYDVDPQNVRLLGPALWAAPGARDGASLNGAWYAAPDPALRADFDQQYAAANGSPAPGLADIAYDAASIARVLAQEGVGYNAPGLCRPEGFAGVNGVLALQPNGTVRRGLALFEIHGDGPQMIEPAPASLSAPGI
jgi:hypothetical protein